MVICQGCILKQIEICEYQRKIRELKKYTENWVINLNTDNVKYEKLEEILKLIEQINKL